jgi:hypothetical protein
MESVGCFLTSRLLVGRECVEIMNPAFGRALQGQIALYDTVISTIQKQLTHIGSLESRLSAAWATWTQYKQEADRSDAIMASNKAVLFPGTPKHYYSTGFNTFDVIDERGVPQIYQTKDKVKWQPEKGDQHVYVTGDGAGGFIRYGKGGLKQYYTPDGLYRGEEDRTGNQVRVERNGNGEVTKITDAHGNLWTVSYTGKVITGISVTVNFTASGEG